MITDRQHLLCSLVVSKSARDCTNEKPFHWPLITTRQQCVAPSFSVIEKDTTMSRVGVRGGWTGNGINSISLSIHCSQSLLRYERVWQRPTTKSRQDWLLLLPHGCNSDWLWVVSTALTNRRVIASVCGWINDKSICSQSLVDYYCCRHSTHNQVELDRWIKSSSHSMGDFVVGLGTSLCMSAVAHNEISLATKFTNGPLLESWQWHHSWEVLYNST